MIVVCSSFAGRAAQEKYWIGLRLTNDGKYLRWDDGTNVNEHTNLSFGLLGNNLSFPIVRPAILIH